LPCPVFVKYYNELVTNTQKLFPEAVEKRGIILEARVNISEDTFL